MPNPMNPADTIEHWELDRLQPDPANARTHSLKQVQKIARLIESYGWTSAILADENGRVIAGHGRLQAARLLGLPAVPVMVARGWTDEQKRAYALADNRVALEAGWDEELLALEPGRLAEAGADLGLTAFDDDEIAERLETDDEEAGEAGARLRNIETRAVRDQFWLQLSGPLALQADALELAKQLVAKVPGVELTLGTTRRD